MAIVKFKTLFIHAIKSRFLEDDHTHIQQLNVGPNKESQNWGIQSITEGTVTILII